MSEINAEVMRSRSCARAFRTMMWAFLFFLPLPIPLAGVRPDLVGWLLVLVALRPIVRLHPTVRSLRTPAMVGLVLWVSRLLVRHVATETQEQLSLALYLATWAVLTVFVWKVCSLVAEMAAQAGATALRSSASWRRWLCVGPFLLLALGAELSGKAQLPVVFLFLLAATCVVSLLMGLMASTARMCAQASQAVPEEEGPSGGFDA